MPTRPDRPCQRPGCAAFVSDGPYCYEHRPAIGRDYDQGRRKTVVSLARAAVIRSSAKWQKIRAYERHKWPVCSDPFVTDCREQTRQINHIHPLETHPELAYVESNHAPVCFHCHARVSVLERAGTDTVALFNAWFSRYPTNFGKNVPLLQKFTSFTIEGGGGVQSLGENRLTPTG